MRIPFAFFLLCITLACQPADRSPETQHRVPTTTVAASDTTQALFDRVMAAAQANQWHADPFGLIVQKTGEVFLGRPYEAGMLDRPTEETLIVSLESFDCVLYVEAVLALARGIAVKDYSFATFEQHLQDQRYRNGQLDGYCSRLHYFSEWIANNEARGTVTNITQALGGDKLDKQLTFMSTNRESYPRFATNDSLFQGIQQMEADLADLTLFYIPQDRIRTVYDQLQPGDIIATATHIEGLDVTHTGFVHRNADGQTGLMHASTAGSVMVSPDIQAYIENNRVQIGIVVARPADPRSTRGEM